MSRLLYENLHAENREIRVLAIKASTSAEAPIECSLNTVSLNDDFQYLALSYVWGDAKVTCDIDVNGFELAVTTNLAAALRQLRTHRMRDLFPLRGLPLLLWADAICINQSNESEKNSQVRMMKDIYQRAEKVISWIGPEADDSALAIPLLWTIFCQIIRLGKNDDKFAWLERFPSLTMDTSDKPNQRTAWDAFNSLWGRDYWRRVWILQETVLAKDIFIMCGEANILPWLCIWAIKKWAEEIKVTDERPSFITSRKWREFAGQHIFNPRPLNRCEILRRVWHQPNAEKQAKEIGFLPLQLSLELDATDPRDKVFGVLGVMNVNITPDYSISVRDLYIRTASEFLQLHGLTRTLNLAGRKRDNPYNLPSWVPDWSRKANKMSVPAHISNMEDAAPETIDFSTEGCILRVTGIRLSEVQELEEATPPYAGAGSSLQTAWKFSKRYLEEQGDRMYATGIPPLQAVMRLLLQDDDLFRDNAKLEIPSDNFFAIGSVFVGALCACGENTHVEFNERCHMNLPKLGLSADENFARSFSQLLLGANSPLGPWQSATTALYGNFSAYVKLARQLDLILEGNRLFQMANGYIGIGPNMMELGDLIYGLKGCNFPIILRQVDSHYRLVGTCHIHGLMGEEIQLSLQDTSKLEQLGIR